MRILDGENGTAALTRVLIDTQNGTQRWSTVGASTNIIEASWLALADSVEYGLAQVSELLPVGAELSVVGFESLVGVYRAIRPYQASSAASLRGSPPIS